jgi:hypothetical protein
LGILVSFLGSRLKPAKFDIGGYRTIRDLIVGMKNKINTVT